MTALVLPAVAVLVAVGVADGVSGSWQLLIRPTTVRAMSMALLGRTAAASVGGLLWASVCTMAWGTGYSSVPVAAVTTAVTAAKALWPLVFAVLGRLPVAGGPLLRLVHGVTVVHVVVVAPLGTGVPPAWAAALFGYLAFATCRAAAAPSSIVDLAARVRGVRHAH
jgi:hypothetical protein